MCNAYMRRNVADESFYGFYGSDALCDAVDGDRRLMQTFNVHLKNTNKSTTASGGSLGSQVDEERS